MQLRRSFGLGQQLRTQADEGARRHQPVGARPAAPVRDDVFHAPLAPRQQLRHRPEVLLGDVERNALHGLVDLTVDQLGQHLRLAHGELEPFPAHQFDQHGQGELAAALDLPGVGPLRGLHPDGDVPD